MFDLNVRQLKSQIAAWLEEDIATGDISSMATISPDHQSIGILHVKETGVVTGLPIAQIVFAEVDPELNFRPCVEEGSLTVMGTVIAEVSGRTRSILAAERLALNLLQRLSGIATKTRSFIEALEGLPVRLVDTRKTTPGLRSLEKYAIRIGGGYNHRFGLYDAVMIKDNHIKASGGIINAVRSARIRIPHTMKIEVETENMEQVEEALGAGADIIMLDNMSLANMSIAVSHIKEVSQHTVVEASGGVSLQTVKSIALTGVDVISIGSLTHSIHSLDISLDLNERKES
ncbi:MAG: carboxylating nicotinate-nucleotide diphosphorylase [Paenibacillaceae bacterium]